MKLVILVCFYLRAIQAAVSQLTSNVMGGYKAPLGKYPFQVLIYVTSRKGAVTSTVFCGGSLIDNKHILSAAHCFDRNEGRYKVKVGAGHVMRSKLIMKKGKHVYCNPDYVSYVRGDIAMVLLESPFKMKEGLIEAVQLATRSPEVNESCFIMGWGQAESEPNPVELRMAEVKIKDTEECSSNYSSIGIFHVDKEKVICANNPPADTCRGDSGGPLICNGKLVGITSFGSTNCGSRKLPGVFTNIVAYRDWITEAKVELEKMASKSPSTTASWLKQIIYSLCLIPLTHELLP